MQQAKKPQLAAPSIGWLQRNSAQGCKNETVPPIVHKVLRSPGEPLDVEARAFFEPLFMHDFDHVRVHTDTKAAESARAVNALAYTVGRDVVFGAGQYQPGTLAGVALLSHELAHVMEQSAASLPLLQRRDARTATPAASTGIDVILAHLRDSPADTTDEEWRRLSKAVRGRERADVLAGDIVDAYFTRQVKSGALTWETVTEDQRAVFKCLSASRQEELRLVAIRYSPVFMAVSNLHVDLTAEDAPQQRSALDDQRLGIGPGLGLNAGWGSIFETFDAITGEVLSMAGARESNQALADYVTRLRKQGWNPADVRTKLGETVHPLKCGIINLFALSAARGKAQVSHEGVRAWFRHWTLEVSPGQAILEVSGDALKFSTFGVMRDLSSWPVDPKTGILGHRSDRIDIPAGIEFNKPDSEKKFQATLESGLRQIRSGGREARVGLVEGHGRQSHTYIVYKDLDGIWRTMDVYLRQADMPAGGLPFDPEYVRQADKFKLVSEKPQ